MASRFRPWMFVSAAWMAPALLAIASRLGQARLWGERTPSLPQLLFESLDWLIYGFFAPAIFAISARWPLTRPGARRYAWLVHILAAIGFCAAWAGAGTVLKAVLGTDSFDQGVMVSFVGWFYITLPFGTGAYFGMVAIEHAIRHFTAARNWETEAARAAEQLTAARLAALHARLNPHFLFNSLNTVAVLIREGAGTKAATVVEQLSNVLRRTLSQPSSGDIPLGSELFLVRQYLAVEQARFSDRLRPTFDIPDELLAAAVPAFALQHLVENAVRHGIAKRSDAGVIAIGARRKAESLVLIVADDGPGMDPATALVTGHGLENTRARLEAMYGGRGSVVVVPKAVGGTIATLTIPYAELPFNPADLDDA